MIAETPNIFQNDCGIWLIKRLINLKQAKSTMNPEESQIDITPEEAKASLGIATRLQDALQPKGQSEQQPQENSQPDSANIEQVVEKKIDEKLNSFKHELLSMLEDESEETTQPNNEA